GGLGNGKEFDGNQFEEGENAASGSNQSDTKTDTIEGSDSTKAPDGSTPPEMPSGNQGVGMNPFEKGENAASSSNQSNTKTDTTEGSDSTKAPDGSAPPEMPDRGKGGGFGGGAGMGSADVKLQYIDDELDSYSNIWNNAKTKGTEADQKRLVESLKKLSNAEELESVVEIEEVIRYFVVHNYVCNGDSYTGTMVHNYYLYEEVGRMSMIPWDYNLAFGTFQGGNAQSTVNTPIDSPVSGGSGEDRPMWNWILSDESYTEQYHQYFAEFLDTVDLQSIIDNAYQLIAPYVEQDPTAFYTKEEFEQGVQTLKEFCSLRSESISMQLEEGETTEEMDYVDASGMTLSDMGSMNNGMGREGGGQNRMPGNLPSRQEQTQESGADESTGESSGSETLGELNSGQSNQTRREFPSQNPG
ncbi:MAG: CotH kinase family protein, partial [Negativibacillus sp.]|nr:CotH kinase family protein [Negativibacillus sp.]